jgi:hypothetical protein
LAGDYAKGIAILSELFVTTQNPGHIYNQGRCFEQNHRYEDAAARFQEFLRVGRKLSKSDKLDAEQHIVSCRELSAKQRTSESPGGGGDSNEAKKRAAKKACLNGEPAKGIELLTDLYVDTNDPTFIFNQGRCYEQNNLCNEAIVRFREYLRKTPNGTERDRTDVAKHIADCEALLAKNGIGAAAPTIATAGPAPAIGTTQTPVERTPTSDHAAVPEESVAASPSGQALPGAGLRVAGILTMSAGGASVIAGVVLNLKHNSMVRGIQNDYSGSTADSAQTYRTWSMVGYGVGAACLVGGGVFYWLGHRASKALLVPGLVAGRTGMLLTGEF